jgi:hypothetical protein
MKMPVNSKLSISLFSSWRLECIVNTCILFFTFVVILYCVWMLDRGFEITDEAYYILLAAQATSQKFYISAQHWITSGLWQITGTLTMFRAAGMLALLLTSMLLALGTISACLRFGVIKDSMQAKGVVIACSVVSAMLYASTINFSPCYNLLASAGAYAAAGLVLLASKRSRFSQKYIFYFFAGCAVSVELLCKASAGVSTLVILIAWLFVFESSYSQKVFGLGAIATGAFAFAGIALMSSTTISDAAQAIEGGMQLFRIVQVEAVDARLIRYINEFGYNIMLTAVAFALPLISFALYAKTRRTIFAKLGVGSLVVSLLLGGYFFGGWKDGSLFTPPFAIVAMLTMALVVSIPFWNQSRNLVTLFVGLILLPYSVAMGTGNNLFTQIIVSIAPWGTLIGVLVIARFPENFGKIPILLVGFCFIATVSSQIVSSSFQPYHMSTPLINQDMEFSTGGLGIVKVDADTYKFLRDIDNAAKNCNILPGSPLLGLYNVPGVAVALKAIPIMSPWLNNIEQAEFVLSRWSPEEFRSMVVVLNMSNVKDFPPLPMQLKSFPSGYQLCGVATYPYMKQTIQVWISLNR